MNNKFSSSHKNEEPESNVLYIVGTPIGNLQDISLRALNILKNVSLIACEDTRQTRKLMNKYEFSNNLISFNMHNSQVRIPKLINDLKLGNSVALVSDAGMPIICDPGEEFVKKARINGIKIICIPGPCAAITALVTSGLPSSKFTFEGFLPKKKSEREKILFELSESKKTIILFESPQRLKNLLEDLKKYFGGERKIQVSRELTKKFEEQISFCINEVIDHFLDKNVKGEITIVIEGDKRPRDKIDFKKLEFKKELDALVMAGLSLPQASKYLAKKNKLPKSFFYNM